jgi:hypothetical protein
MLPALVIGSTVNSVFIEFIEAWKSAGARMLPRVRL